MPDLKEFFYHRYQRENEKRRKTQPKINVQRIASIKPGRVKANSNSLSPMLTVPTREGVPLNSLRSEAHINKACTDANVDQIVSLQV